MLLPQQNVTTNVQPIVSASLVYANSNNNTPAATSRTPSRAQSRASNTPRDVASLELPSLNLQENAPSNDNIIVEIQSVEELPDTIINTDQNSILNPVSSNDMPIDQENIQVMNQNSVISVNLDNIVVDENADNNDDAFLM
jgi:hypothetical protein